MPCVLIEARTPTVSSETRYSPPSTGSVSSVSSLRAVRSSSARTLHRDLTQTTASGKTFSVFLHWEIILIIMHVGFQKRRRRACEAMRDISDA